MAQKNYQENIQKLEQARNSVNDVFNWTIKNRQQASDVATKRFLSKSIVELESSLESIEASKVFIEKASALHEIEMQQQEQETNGSAFGQSYKASSRRMQTENS